MSEAAERYLPDWCRYPMDHQEHVQTEPKLCLGCGKKISWQPEFCFSCREISRNGEKALDLRVRSLTRRKDGKRRHEVKFA